MFPLISHAWASLLKRYAKLIIQMYHIINTSVIKFVKNKSTSHSHHQEQRYQHSYVLRTLYLVLSKVMEETEWKRVDYISLTRMPFCPDCITCELKIDAFMIVGLRVGTWLIYQSVVSFKFFPFWEPWFWHSSMNCVWVLFTDTALTLASIVRGSFYWLLLGGGGGFRPKNSVS